MLHFLQWHEIEIVQQVKVTLNLLLIYFLFDFIQPSHHANTQAVFEPNIDGSNLEFSFS